MSEPIQLLVNKQDDIMAEHSQWDTDSCIEDNQLEIKGTTYYSDKYFSNKY